MKKRKQRAVGLSCLLLAGITSAVTAADLNRNAVADLKTGQAVRSDKSAPLPELIHLTRNRVDAEKHLKPPAYVYPNFLDDPEKLNQADRTRPDENNKALQNFRGGISAPPVDLSFDGIGQSDAPGGGLPPDTNGDVGVEYYVQYINTDWAIYDKVNGNLLGSVEEGNTFWAGFGGPCEVRNAGDPIVLYDKVAEVWVFSQFIGGGTNGAQCFAVSDRRDLLDPDVTFNRYQFDFTGVFNDYPHIGIWTDENGASSGYYLVTHDFGAGGFVGASFSVVERDQMLAGDAAQFIRFQNVTAFGGSSFGALPAHLESSVLPAGTTCAPFVHNRADLDAYLVWSMCVDWDNAADSTLSDATLLPANDVFSSGVADIPQPPPAPSGSELDSFSGRTMYRASARAYPVESGLPVELVINHGVDAGDTRSGVRWVDFALEFSGSDIPADILFANGFEEVEELTMSAKILDQGVFAPDEENRWMGAISIDQSGNIGLGYSVGSVNTFPSVRYTGKTADDPKGLMRDEQSCVVGSGVQTFVDSTGRAGRWGDYSSMSVDPVDQCTFWLTVEYITTTGVANWENRICSFTFPECGEETLILRTDSPQEIEVCTLTDTVELDVQLYALGGYSDTTTLSGAGIPGGASVSFSDNNISTFPSTVVATLEDLDLVAVSEFDFTIQALGSPSGLLKDLEFNASVSSAIAPATNLQLPANGTIDIAVRPDFNWDAVAEALSYTVEIATDSAFTDVVETGVTETNSYTASSPLSGGTEYFWRVTAMNNCGPGGVSGVFSFTTSLPGSCPAGSVANVVFFDDIEGDVSDWSTPADPIGSGNTWAQSGVRVNSGVSSFLAVDVATTSDQYLVSPSITLPSAAEGPLTLSFWNYQNIEANTGSGVDACWDGGILEVSTDGGTTFTQVINERLLTDGYNGSVTVQSATPLSGLDAWCADDIVPASGEQETISIVDIDDYAGQTVQFRFRMGTDGAVGDEGWYIDDVTVQSCQAP